MNVLRVPWILDGPWYQILLTNFVLLSLIFLAGLLFGLIYRRFGTIGMVILSAGLVLILLGAVLVATWQRWRPQFGSFLVNRDILSATGILAIVAALVAEAGYGTIRGLRV